MAERRQVPRYVSDLKAQIHQPSSSSPLGVKVVTLSVRGICIDGADPLNQGQKCQLRIDWQGKQFQADVEVVWKTKEGRAGLKFVASAHESEGLLREICATLQLQPLARLPEEPDSIPPPRSR